MAFYEAGKYEVEITAQGYGRSKEKNTPYFWLGFRVLRRKAEDGSTTATAQYERDAPFYLTEKTVERVEDDLKTHLEWEGSWSDIDPTMPGHFSFTGRVIDMECRLEYYDGKEYEKWQFPFAGGAVNQEAAKGISRELDALFGKAKKKPAKSLKQEAEEVSAAAKDEIPF